MNGFWRHVNRMNGSEAFVQETLGREQCDGRSAVLLNAGRNLGGLFRHVHVNRQSLLVSVADYFFQIIERHRAHTVWRNTNPGAPFLVRTIRSQLLKTFQIKLRIGFDEPSLLRIRIALVTGTGIGDPQQSYAQPHVTGGAHDFFGQQIWIVVLAAIRRVVQIVKLPDGGDAAERHLEKRHARRVIDIIRSEARCGAVHHLAPGPKTVLFVSRAMFRAPANHSLKGMRVRVNQAGQQRAVLETDNIALISPLSGRVSVTTCLFITDNCYIALKATIRVDQIGEPGNHELSIVGEDLSVQANLKGRTHAGPPLRLL